MEKNVFTIYVLGILAVIITGCSNDVPGMRWNGERQPVNVHMNTIPDRKTCIAQERNNAGCNIVKRRLQNTYSKSYVRPSYIVPSANYYVTPQVNYSANPSMHQYVNPSKVYLIQVGVDLEG